MTKHNHALEAVLEVLKEGKRSLGDIETVKRIIDLEMEHQFDHDEARVIGKLRSLLEERIQAELEAVE